MKILISTILLVVSLMATEKKNIDMGKIARDVIDKKEAGYSIKMLADYVYSFKDRGEFETMEEYKARVIKKLGDGIFYVYKRTEASYDVDKQEMVIISPFHGVNGSYREKPDEVFAKQGFTDLSYVLKFNNNFPIRQKLEANGHDIYFNRIKIKMAVDEAKRIKNEKSMFYGIVAVKITPNDILKRNFDVHSGKANGVYNSTLVINIYAKKIGTSLVSINPNEIITAYSIEE
ncbi:MAG: hypothetical protein U9R50_02335 [Campylobacterota bacterium]|nr:hypothetical protein [Campylobacterota bacterium]